MLFKIFYKLKRSRVRWDYQRNTKFLILLILVGLMACKKLVEIGAPSAAISEDVIYTTDATAIGVLNGLYTSMNTVPIQGIGTITSFTGLSSDELALYSGSTNDTYLGYYTNKLQASLSGTASGSELWPPLYSYIFKCNAAIEGLNLSTSLTRTVKEQLLGEAKFMRGFFYFYLVNLFGDVPLVLTTDPQVNSLISRSSKTAVYEAIIKDFEQAEELLSNSFVDVTLLSPTSERTRPTKWAASAMLARVYLYAGNYIKAEEKASIVIGNTSLFGPLPSMNNAFLKNSREAIWQLQPTVQFFNTQEARTLIIPPQGPNINNNPVILSKILLSSFELNDQRKTPGNWIDTTIYKPTSTTWDTVYYAYKYKKNEQDINIVSTTTIQGYTKMAEYFMILRLAEQYLIRAEARAQRGNISGAQEDLNIIRTRAGLGNISAADQASLLIAILNERRHELFVEWGHRWLDLKRTGKVDEVMSVVTPLKSNGAVQWQPFQALYPIPLTDIQRNPNLLQNKDY